MAKLPIKQLSDLAKSAKKQRVSLAAWIEANVQLPIGITAEPGPIELAPYMRELADSLVDPAVEKVSIVKAARVGYSTVLAGLVAYLMTEKPTSVLLVVPAERDARNAVVDLEQIFDASPALHGRFPTPATAGRSSRNTLLTRLCENGARFRGVGANAPRNLRAVNAEYVLADEADAIVTAKAEGNALDIAAKRSLSFPNRKLITGSTPIMASTSQVCRLFNESDQRVYEFRCPHCREYAEPQWEQISWPDNRPEEAVWSCPECGADVEEKHKARMVKEGRWHALKPEVRGHRGYRLSALISSLPGATWAKLAAEYELVRNDPDRLRVFWNTCLARPWNDDVADININALMEKAEDFSLDNIPAEVLALTLGGDNQDDRIEATVTGWSRDGVCYILHHEVFYASDRSIVDDSEVWKQFDAFLRRRWPHPSGGFLKIDAACLDASDGDHMATVLQFCRVRAGRRVMAIKGLSGFSRPPLIASQNKTKHGRLWLVGSDFIKSRIYDQLAKGKMFRFSNTLSETFYEQLCSENVVIRMVGGRPIKRFERVGRMAAEALDTTCYAIAAKTALHLSPAFFEQREHEMRDQVALGTGEQEKPEQVFAKDTWFGAERGGLRDANGR